MLTIATVLRGGGEYEPKHVIALHDMVAAHAPAHRFVCLSDVADMPVETIRLEHDWPRWWPKIELFKLPGPVLYFDLDTIIRGDIAPLIAAALPHRFVILRDFYRGQYDRMAMQSSMMFWRDDQRVLYDEFVADPRFYWGGDQEWLENHLGIEPVMWQDLIPGATGSFKASKRSEAERVIIFHGKPRPWEQQEIAYAAA